MTPFSLQGSNDTEENESKSDEKKDESVEETTEKKPTEDEDEEEEEEKPRPRALHKTASIFLRNLAPTITKQEVEAVSF